MDHLFFSILRHNLLHQTCVSYVVIFVGALCVCAVLEAMYFGGKGSFQFNILTE